MNRRIRVAPGTVVLAVALTVGAVVGPAGAVAAKRAEVQTVPVTLREFSVRPARDYVKRGTVKFVAKNAGTETHELVLARLVDGRPLPVDADGAVDEDAIATADAIGEAEDVARRRSEAFVAVALTPGTYELFCNIVEEEDGVTLSHYAKGMHAVFVVN